MPRRVRASHSLQTFARRRPLSPRERRRRANPDTSGRGSRRSSRGRGGIVLGNHLPPPGATAHGTRRGSRQRCQRLDSSRERVAEQASPPTANPPKRSGRREYAPFSAHAGRKTRTSTETTEARVAVRSVGMQRSIERIVVPQLRRAATPGGAINLGAQWNRAHPVLTRGLGDGAANRCVGSVQRP